MKRFICYAVPLISVMALIFYMSSLSYIPESGVSDVFSIKPLIYHFSVFLLLAFLSKRCFAAYNFNNPALTAFIFVLLYSLTDEMHQYFVPNRNFDIFDILIDNLGSFMIVFYLFYKTKTRKADIRTIKE